MPPRCVAGLWRTHILASKSDYGAFTNRPVERQLSISLHLSVSFHNSLPLASCHQRHLINARIVPSGTDDRLKKAPWLAPVLESQEEQVCIQSNNPKTEEGEA